MPHEVMITTPPGAKCVWTECQEHLKAIREEVEGFHAICNEYLDGSPDTMNHESLHAQVDNWTEEISTLNEHIDEQDEKIEDLEKQVFDLTEEREKKVLDLDVFYKAEWNACEELKKLKAEHNELYQFSNFKKWKDADAENKKLKEQIKDQDDYDIDVSVNYWKSGWEILQTENKKLKAEIDDAVENHFADLKLRETTHKEWDTLQTENDKLKAEIAELKKTE